MKARNSHRSLVLSVVLGSILTTLSPLAVESAEIAATHLVFEKPVKMKKADTFLFLPLVDQSSKSDSIDRDRLISCRVFAESKGGPLVVRGSLRLQLIGEVNATGAFWQSETASQPIDADGRARFQPAAILELVDEARSDRAEARLTRIDYRGGKGKKVSKLTVDCENREVAP
jgi:hypothetical protein